MRPDPAVACIPSRGLIHSRTIEGVLRETPRLLVTHDLPIPDCFNELRRQALESGAERIWFVEEDMLLPEGILARMSRGGPMVCVDYPNQTGGHTVQRKDGEPVMCGTGCLLFRRDVLERVGEFRTTVQYLWPDLEPVEMSATYGGHDADFCVRARQLGYRIEVMDEPVKHLRVRERGQALSNNGVHRIVVVGE